MSGAADEQIACIERWAADRRLGASCLQRWLKLEEADRTALFRTAQDLRLRSGQFEVAFGLLAEIALRERTTPAEILARDELRRAIGSAGSAPARAKALLDALRAARFPQLREMTQRLNARIAALSLPPAIKIVLPKDLSSDELKVELTVRSGAELTRMIETLESRTHSLAELAEILAGGGDEI